jgi:ankyrin repeat protein
LFFFEFLYSWFCFFLLSLLSLLRLQSEQALKEKQQSKKKLLKQTEELWGKVMSLSSGALSTSSTASKQVNEEASLWKNYIVYMFYKITSTNHERYQMMKKSIAQSKQIVDNLNQTSSSSASSSSLSPEVAAILKDEKAIRNLLIDTMSRLFVRTVINDGKRKVLLSYHLKIREHELMLLYGSEEYLQKEKDRKAREKAEKERIEKEKQRKEFIHYVYAPQFVDEYLEKGKDKAFNALYDRFWTLDLSPTSFLSKAILERVEKKFYRCRNLLLSKLFRLLAIPYREKKVSSHHLFLQKQRIFSFLFKSWNNSSLVDKKAISIQHFIRCFLFKCRFIRHLQREKLLLQKGNNYYNHQYLQKKAISRYLFWWKKTTELKKRYHQTKEALQERRFLICFYSWKNIWKKVTLQKMKLTAIQLQSCLQIQCFIRRYLAKCFIYRLQAKKKLSTFFLLMKAKKVVRKERVYVRRCEDSIERVKFNAIVTLLRFSYRKWLKSYFLLKGLTKIYHCYQHYNLRHRYEHWKYWTSHYTSYLTKSVIKIQSMIRMYLVYRHFFNFYRFRRNLIRVQSLYRRYEALSSYKYEVFYFRKAKKIQSFIRGHRTRKNLYLSRVNDIHYAASHNNYEKLKYYCSKYPELIPLKDKDGNTPLHAAARNAAKRTMKLLIKYMKFNPNEENYEGYSPLHLLIMSNAVNRDDLFTYCLERGFDDDQLTSTGKSCLLLAVEYNRMIILKRLLDDGHDTNLADNNGLTALQSACSQGNAALVQLLIDNEANIIQSGLNGTFPLHDSVTGRNIEVLYSLLSASSIETPIDVNVVDPFYSQTPLMWAAQAGLSDFIRTLLFHHARIDCKDYQGRTVAHYAALCNIPDVYHALREGDVEFDILDSEGNSPLHLTAYYGTVEMTKNILHGGAYPSYQNDLDGEQPSHIACKYNSIEILKLLCEYDEYIGRPNYSHLTPLGLAKIHHSKECIDFLEKHYRSVEIIDGRNAIGEIWWDKTIDESILSQWEMKIQNDGTRVYLDRFTGEISLKPPSIESADIIKNLAMKKNKLPLRRVIEMVKEDDDADDDENDAEATGDGDREEKGTGITPIKGKKEKKKKLTKHEYYLNYQKEKEEIAIMSIEYRSATIINKYIRRKLAYLHLKQMKVLKAKFKILRQFYRLTIKPWMIIRKKNKLLQVIRIQKRIRGYLSRKHFYSFPSGLYYSYRIRKAKRILRYKLWSIYCFYRFHKEFSLKVKIKHHFNYTLHDWQLILDRVRYPIRIIGIFEEYRFPNTMNLMFYRNTLTGNCFFTKPKEMTIKDEEERKEKKEKDENFGVTIRQLRLIIKLQSLFRGYHIRNSYKYLEKALIISQYAYENYMTNPEKDANVYNYALYCLTMLQDIDRSRSILLEALRRMQWRGPDNAFVLYSYAIFAMKSHDEDINDILVFIERGNAAEKIKYESIIKKLEMQYQYQSSSSSSSSSSTSSASSVVSPVGSVRPSSSVAKTVGIGSPGGSVLTTPRDHNSLSSPRDMIPAFKKGVNDKGTTVDTSLPISQQMQPFRYGRCYDLAKVGFFRYCATTKSNSYAWECYALCLFLIYKDFTGSFDAFLAAFKTDPNNKKLRRNFDLMMIYFHGKDKDIREEVIQHRMRYLADLDNEIEENRRRARERATKRDKSAARIQKWYKDRKSLRIFNLFISAVRLNMKKNGSKGSPEDGNRRGKRQNIQYR